MHLARGKAGFAGGHFGSRASALNHYAFPSMKGSVQRKEEKAMPEKHHRLHLKLAGVPAVSQLLWSCAPQGTQMLWLWPPHPAHLSLTVGRTWDVGRLPTEVVSEKLIFYLQNNELAFLFRDLPPCEFGKSFHTICPWGAGSSQTSDTQNWRSEPSWNGKKAKGTVSWSNLK